MARRTFIIPLSATIWLACLLASGAIAQTAAGNGSSTSPVNWASPWPIEGKADYGYPLLRGVKSFPIYHATPLTGTYSHHSQIGHFHDAFFASWSNQQWDEDSPGQRVLCAISKNGRQWRGPFTCFPSMGGMKRSYGWGRVLTAEAWVVAGNAIYVVADVNDRPGECNKISDGFELTRGGKKRDLFDRRVGWGRIARSVSPDGKMGPIFWLVDDPPNPLRGFPQYPDATDPRFREVAQEINRVLANPLHMPAWDFLNHTARRIAADGHRLCEPSVYKRPDGVLVKLSRDCGPHESHRMYASLSRDGGKTWTPAVRTDIPDSPSKAVSGTLPNGLNYLIGNQVPLSAHGVRDPLVISLSKDGKIFNWTAAIVHGTPARRYAGRSKDLGFQYPSAIVVGNSMWVIYSIDKEDVAVSRVPLSDLRISKQR